MKMAAGQSGTMRIGKDVEIQETEDFLNKVFYGKIGLMLNAMVQQKALSQQELDELSKILQENETD